MLNLNGAIDDRFEEEIDRAVESLKMGYLDKSYLVKGNKMLQAAYDKYFERTKDSFLKAKCLRNLSKVCGLLNNKNDEKKYSQKLYWIVTEYDEDFKKNNKGYYCMSINEYIETFKKELNKEEKLKIHENIYKIQKELGNTSSMIIALNNTYLLKEEYDKVLILLKDIHTSNINDKEEIEKEILHDLETSNDFYYRQAENLINQSSSLQVM